MKSQQLINDEIARLEKAQECLSFVKESMYEKRAKYDGFFNCGTDGNKIGYTNQPPLTGEEKLILEGRIIAFLDDVNPFIDFVEMPKQNCIIGQQPGSPRLIS